MKKKPIKLKLSDITEIVKRTIIEKNQIKEQEVDYDQDTMVDQEPQANQEEKSKLVGTEVGKKLIGSGVSGKVELKIGKGSDGKIYFMKLKPDGSLDSVIPESEIKGVLGLGKGKVRTINTEPRGLKMVAEGQKKSKVTKKRK